MTTKIHNNSKQNVMTFYKFVQKRYDNYIETYGFEVLTIIFPWYFRPFLVP